MNLSVSKVEKYVHTRTVYQIYVHVCMFFWLRGWEGKEKRKKAVNIEEMKQRRKTGKKDAGLYIPLYVSSTTAR